MRISIHSVDIPSMFPLLRMSTIASLRIPGITQYLVRYTYDLVPGMVRRRTQYDMIREKYTRIYLVYAF